MANVMSRVASHREVPFVSPLPRGYTPAMLDMFHLLCFMRAQAVQGTDQDNALDKLPTEIRLIIFKYLLVVKQTVLRGAKKFGPLLPYEVDFDYPWQILATCRQFYDEAWPIMYSENRFVFCTGATGRPGMFWRFPIALRYMAHVRDLGIYFRVDRPWSESQKRVSLFIKALARRATNLEHLTIMAASDRYYEARCPWDVVSGEHPVFKELEKIVEKGTAKHLKIRLHDGALFTSRLASWLNQVFEWRSEEGGYPKGRSLSFSRSCSWSCPPGCQHQPTAGCNFPYCEPGDDGMPPFDGREQTIDNLFGLEANIVRQMNLEHDLFELGILPGGDDDEETDETDERDEDYYSVHGPYRIPRTQVHEQLRYEFYPAQDNPDGHVACYIPAGAPGSGRARARAFRGEQGKLVPVPKEWFFRQSEIDEFFKPVEHELSFGRVRGYLGEYVFPWDFLFRQTEIDEFFKPVEYEEYLEAAFRPMG